MLPEKDRVGHFREKLGEACVCCVMNPIKPKLESFGYSFAADSMDLASVNLTLAPKTTALGEITQNNSHCAVQGHSRSSLLVPIESPYATSYY